MVGVEDGPKVWDHKASSTIKPLVYLLMVYPHSSLDMITKKLVTVMIIFLRVSYFIVS